jgi:hypothetical protein
MSMTNQTQRQEFGDPFPGVEARPLQLPDFVNVKPKNPGVSFRWVNRSVGIKESTQRLDEMIFAGFVPARPDECMIPDQKGGHVPIPPNLIKDGKIIRGDLMLMKIDKKAYEGALKYNWQRSVSRLHPDRQLQTGQKQLATAVSQQGIPAGMARTLASKLQAFRPGSSDKPADPNFMAEDDKLSSERKED